MALGQCWSCEGHEGWTMWTGMRKRGLCMQSSQHAVLVAAEMVSGLGEVGENEFKEKGKLKIYFHLLILNSCYFVLLMGENENKEEKSDPSSTFLTNIFYCCNFLCHLGYIILF